MDGIVKWFDPKKGYGFIRGSDGKDYFVHASCLTEETINIFDGTKVTFDTESTLKGIRAINIKFAEEFEID